jgi:hypothetical protein
VPRADPARSPYCASRHLLRNLDDVRELRRNPLVKNLFLSGARSRGGEHDRHAADRIRHRVSATLARLRDHAGERRNVRLGRLHAALLRCEIDSQPLAVVAAELGLSERQLRRERQTAHAIFLRAFDRHVAAPPETARTSVSPDTAAVRLREGAELHELGESDLAASVLLKLERSAPRADRRIEAALLGAEIEIERARFPEARARIAEAKATLVERRDELDERARVVAEEHLELTEWSVRRHTELAGGVAARPPSIVARADWVQAFGGERHRALLVRALASYAGQRWECGDATSLRAAVQRAAGIVPSLDTARVTERLAVRFAEARGIGLNEPLGRDTAAFAELERIARANGHVRIALAARVERLGGVREPQAQLLHEIVASFGPRERRMMPATFAAALRVAAQAETALESVAEAAALAEALAAPRSADALLAKCARVRAVLRAACEPAEYEEAAALAHDVLADAELAGNARVRGSAHRYLARIASARGCRHEALRHIAEAVPLLDRFGTYVARSEAQGLARRLGVL